MVMILLNRIRVRGYVFFSPLLIPQAYFELCPILGAFFDDVNRWRLAVVMV
jgi:hypothetical protein